MSNITLPRATVEQVLETIEGLTSDRLFTAEWAGKHGATIAALRAALAQQDEPKPMSPEQRQRWEELAAMPQQAEPVQEPVAWVNQANLASARLTRDRGGQGDTHTWSETRSNYHGVPLYTAPPQRKLVPLTEAEIEHIGITHQSLRQVVRAVERAHGIGETK